MITESEFDKINVSFYDNVKASKRLDMPVSRVLKGIKNCAYEETISRAREAKRVHGKDAYDKIKSTLPAVTFCGTFDSGHKADECNHYNNLLVIDIDHISETGEFDRIKKILEDDPYIAALWISPSGEGFKGLIHLEYSEELEEIDVKDRHRLAFKQLFTYLFNNYEISLDESGKDISRLCYMCADESISIKEEAKPFVVYPEVENTFHESKLKGNNQIKIKNVENKDWNKINGQAIGYSYNNRNKNMLLYIYRKLKKRNLSITETWGDWVKVAYSIASSIHPVKGREIFLSLCRLDGANHSESKSEYLIWKAYCENRGNCTIKTIIYLAKRKGIELGQ